MIRRLPAEQEPNRLARLLEERRAAGRPILDLTVTNPTAVGLPGLGPEVLRALADPRAATYEPDPRGLPSAREAIAASYAAEGIAADPRRIFLTSSTSEAYAHLFRVLCEPGDEVLVPRPSYPLIQPIAALESVRAVPYRLLHDGGWRLDVDSLEGAIGARTRAIVAVEPNNPTGSVFSARERDAVEENAARRGLALIADEVFREFPWAPRAAPLPTWLGERRVPTFVLGGISKSCGLPQMKLGWIAAAGPPPLLDPIAARLEWTLDLFLSVGTPVQIALPALLAGGAAFRKAAASRIGESLARWRDWAARAPGAAILEGEGGWSVVARLPAPRGGAKSGDRGALDLAETALADHGILLHPGHFYDLDDDRLVVAGLLAPPETLDMALRRLEHGIGGGVPG